MTDVVIVCIEGCHGSGKTKIINQLKSLGYDVLDENFINMPSLGMKPQSFTMEMIWVSRWIERALELKKSHVPTAPTVQMTKSKPRVYFADRSPYSAILYAEWGVLLKPIINQNIIDLKRVGIKIVNIYIDVEENTLWDRISARLIQEPERTAYNEGSREHMTKVLDFYKSHDDLWNHKVDNTAENINLTISEVLSLADTF